MVHQFEPFAPLPHLVLDLLPLGFLDFAQLVRLDHDLLVLLVNFRVYDFVADCVDRPLLDIVGADVQKSRQLGVLKVSFVGVETADLHISLLQDHVVFVETLSSHELVELSEFFQEVLGIGLREQIQELEHILVFLNRGC